MIPIPCSWDGETFIPDRRFRTLCDKQFVVGDRYMVDAAHERDMNLHRGYFAAVKDAFNELPGERFLTPDHLRKWALIQCGICTVRQRELASTADAHRVAELIRELEPFADVAIAGRMLVVRTARSQSRREMDADEFQRSKDAVLAFLNRMRGSP